jgi:hypothetical protein
MGTAGLAIQGERTCPTSTVLDPLSRLAPGRAQGYPCPSKSPPQPFPLIHLETPILPTNQISFRSHLDTLIMTTIISRHSLREATKYNNGPRQWSESLSQGVADIRQCPTKRESVIKDVCWTRFNTKCAFAIPCQNSILASTKKNRKTLSIG